MLMNAMKPWKRKRILYFEKLVKNLDRNILSHCEVFLNCFEKRSKTPVYVSSNYESKSFFQGFLSFLSQIGSFMSCLPFVRNDFRISQRCYKIPYKELWHQRSKWQNCLSFSGIQYSHSLRKNVLCAHHFTLHGLFSLCIIENSANTAGRWLLPLHGLLNTNISTFYVRKWCEISLHFEKVISLP